MANETGTPAAPSGAPAPAAPETPAAPPASAPAAPPASEPHKSILGEAGSPKPGEQPKPGEVGVGALEKFEDIKLPEGVTIDAEGSKAFMELATKHKLSREAGQELIDLQVKRELASEKANTQAFEETANAWRDETKKVYGKDYAQMERDAGRFIETFGDPELREVLNLTRVGDNKALFKAMALAGAKLGEDNMAGGRPQGHETKTLAQKFYPNMK